jgi:hypothetical protein
MRALLVAVAALAVVAACSSTTDRTVSTAPPSPVDRQRDLAPAPSGA